VRLKAEGWRRGREHFRLNSLRLTDLVKQHALGLGFDAVGVTTADPSEHWNRYRRWLDAGHAAGMGYLHDHLELKRDPAHVMPGVRSIVVVAKNYFRGDPPTDATIPGGARVSRYAAGLDYHDTVRADLKRLLAYVQELAPGCRGRAAVDSAPLLEREMAARAGVGWIGKNTMLIRRGLGSYFFLGELLLDVDLAPDEPQPNRCGTCRRCVDACPTGALATPGQVDARQCVSCWTVEHRGELPPESSGRLQGWIFGCDLCQEACPWNRKCRATDDERFTPLPHLDPLDVRSLAALNDQAFRAAFRHSPLWRAGRDGLVRNIEAVTGA
jgi:epoxyqueuosine reductase